MKRIVIAFVYLLIATLGCSQVLADHHGHDDQDKKGHEHQVKIAKSDNDHSEYRYLQLSNQMQVLLIADDKADKAAAALDVFVGSSHDPVEREGLAHFLEHMLFLGTDRYPEPDEYQAFISQHGGQHNAYTSFDHTNYFFDVDPANFEATLDRFSRFFVAPLFNAEYVEREKNAVHSEYKARIKNDYRRQRDVFSKTVNPNHPAAKFSVGNLDTLADRPEGKVRDDLLVFYKQHYSANRMTLVVLAPKSLDELESMVRKRFEEVPNYQSVQPEHKQPLFKEGSLPLLLSLKPVQELRQLSVTLPLPAVQEFYHEKPLSYIANLIGHEGKGSLLSLLKEKGLAEGLSAGKGLSDINGSSFDITVSLTPLGLENWQQVLELVFQEIALVFGEGVAEWRMLEQSSLVTMQFRHQELGDPIHRVSQLANQLHQYPYQDVMRGPYLMDRFDAGLIKSMLALMTPKNAMVTLMAPEAETNKTSMLYQVPYSIDALSGMNDKGLSGKELNGESLVSELILPIANEFVPESFELKFPLKADHPGQPALLADKPGYRLWHYPDSYYQVPKAQFYVAVKTPAIANVADAAMAELYLKLVSERLNEPNYAAALAGLGYHANRRPDGIGFVISGFDNKLPVLVGAVADGLLLPFSSQDASSELVGRLRLELIRRWRNGAKDSPYKQLMRETGLLLNTSSWQPEQLAKALEGFDRKVFDQFVAGLYQGATLEIFASGNLHKVDVEQLTKTLASRFVSEAYAGWVNRGVVRIPVGQKTQTHLSIDHKDFAILRYYQGRNDSLDETARVMLLRQVIRSEFFHQLRTEQQLGYVVAAVNQTMDRVPGFSLLVQSPGTSVDKLEEAIDQFLLDFDQQLQDMPKEEFERHRQAVLTGLREKPKSLAEQSARFWGSVDMRDYNFNRREKIIDAVVRLTYKELRDTYKALMMESGYSLQVDSSEGRAWSGDEFMLGRGIYHLPTEKM
jgi:insulysin